MDPFATNYGGHQFGNWAGQLGDGRAISLGETVKAALQARGREVIYSDFAVYSLSNDTISSFAAAPVRSPSTW